MAASRPLQNRRRIGHAGSAACNRAYPCPMSVTAGCDEAKDANTMTTTIPTRQEQIVSIHASLIISVVRGRTDPIAAREAAELVGGLSRSGHPALARILGRIVRSAKPDGADETALSDDERVVLNAVLQGIDNPAALPPEVSSFDPGAAAPGLAWIIVAAARGDPQALHTLSEMAEAMVRVGGDMGRLGGLMRRLVNGERDAERLTRNMGAQGTSLVHAILEQLASMGQH